MNSLHLIFEKAPDLIKCPHTSRPTFSIESKGYAITHPFSGMGLIGDADPVKEYGISVADAMRLVSLNERIESAIVAAIGNQDESDFKACKPTYDQVAKAVCEAAGLTYAQNWAG